MNTFQKYFLLLVILLTSVFSSYGKQDSTQFLFFTNDELAAVKEAVKNNSPEVISLANQLKKVADIVLTKGPWRITDVKSPATSNDPHDYYSEGPYWWPNPDDPDGRYIRKDGVRNPDRFMEHKIMLQKVRQSLIVLGIAAYLFDEEKYADYAEEIIDAWFVNKETRMNPNLDHAQIVRGRKPGNGVGIIETFRFVNLIEALNMLKASGYWEHEQYEATKEWFADYLKWMTESESGLSEKERGNNHSTWWAAQIAAYAGFTGNTGMFDEIRDYQKHFLIDNQIEPDGSQPLEEERTKSLGYSVFNLNAHSYLCRFSKKLGVNMWQYESSDDAGVKTAIDYISPFVREPESWDKQQISEFDELPYYAAFYALDFNDKEFANLYLKYSHDIDFKKLDYSKDPFDLLVNMVLVTNL